MKQFLITYWLEQNRLRRGAIGPWAGAHTMMVTAKTMREAMVNFAHPADCDCYKVEIVPIHCVETEKEAEKDEYETSEG